MSCHDGVAMLLAMTNAPSTWYRIITPTSGLLSMDQVRTVLAMLPIRMMKIFPIPVMAILADMEKLGISKNLKTFGELGLPGTHSLQENVSFNFCATLKTSNVSWYVCRK